MKIGHVVGWGAVVAAAVVGAAVFAGSFNVSARTPHWVPVAKTLEWLRVRSIRSHAAGIAVPDDMGAPERLRGGVTHMEAHCRPCHGAPGEGVGELGQGMYPQPSDLTKAAQRFSPAELFWILQNGIKMTGMPAWADHGDDELWSVVALLGRLPTMSAAEYATLAQAAAAAEQRTEAPATPTPASPPSHAGHQHHHHHHPAK
ncbi:MAG: c-type cytochrome [Bacteroidota bacterium]